MSAFTVYRASAGSGKTFTLTVEYLKLLFAKGARHRQILAVTFTNKATAEMKSRILKELHALSLGEETAYLDIIRKDSGMEIKEIQQKAAYIMQIILHDYSRFRVETIDSFFQKIIRSFARETGLSGSFALELNDSQVLQEVVNDLLLNLESKTETQSWLKEFAIERIKDQKHWNINKEVFSLGQQVFKEDFRAFSEEIKEKFSDKKFLNTYLKELNEITKQFEGQMEQIANDALKHLQDAELSVTDFSYGKTGVVGHFIKMKEKKEYEPGKRVLDALDNPDAWVKKTDKQKDYKLQLVENYLNPLLNQAFMQYKENYAWYQSVFETKRFIYILGILNNISQRIRQYTDENNLFLLSDSSHLLNEIVKENDSPFIYEKVGNTFNHFMIDEFQDTSGKQWSNFYPLILNALAVDKESLIVGDVKQSIYRWRNGDWKILAEKVQEDFKTFDVKNMVLENNWRSSPNVIRFNNSFFRVASELLQNHFNSELVDLHQDEKLSELQEKIVKVYEEVKQEIPKDNYDSEGTVLLELFEKDKEIGWKEKSLERVPEMISDLLNKGYSQGDISILVRTKGEGKLIADTLLAYKNEQPEIASQWKVISNEALYISGSSVVNFIISFMRLLLNPGDKIQIAILLNELKSYIRDEETTELDDLLACIRNKEAAIENKALNELIEELRAYSLFELVTHLYNRFQLQNLKEEDAYYKAFADMVLEFSRSKAADLGSFIDFWDEEGASKSVNVSDNQDAISILTIHKSKGLEFKCVLIPFCDWELEPGPQKAEILWCKPRVEPFNKLDLVPVRYSKNLGNTIYFREYYDERLHAFVDNLNLLYVAFTRAEQVLWIGSQGGHKDLKSVGALTYSSLHVNKSFEGETAHTNLSEHWADEEHYLLGEISTVKSEQEEIEDDYQLEKIALQERAGIRIKSNAEKYMENNPAVRDGKLLHALFEGVDYKEDIPRSVNTLLHTGEINKKEAEHYTQLLETYTSQAEVKDWFSRDWQVKSESSILLPNGKIYRPDRVMIRDKQAIVVDFKHETQSENHKKQVKRYMNLLKDMGYSNVEGYLWYLVSNVVVSIE